MALPVAHAAVALGIIRSRDHSVRAAFLSILPDFDFLLVWGLGLERYHWHRTFSHSLLFCFLLAVVWDCLQPRSPGGLSARLVFAILLSHSLLDLACTADAFDHGVQVLWPLSNLRLGWPILVPLYRLLAPSPFSWRGAFYFTLLEALLAYPLWWMSRWVADRLFGSRQIRAGSLLQ